MPARVLNIARAWGPAIALLWFVAAGIVSAWIIGLQWVAIAAGLFFLSFVVLLAHVWSQVEAALSRGTEESGPGL